MSCANANVLVVRRHLLQLKDSIAELSTAVDNLSHLILVLNAGLEKLQVAVYAHAKAPPSSVFPTSGPEGELQGLKTALEGTNSQVDVLARDLANLFNITDAEFKKVWPAVRSITADVRQSVEACSKLDMKLGRILTDLGNLKVSVASSVRKLNSDVLSVVAAQTPVVPSSFSFTSPFPPVSGSSATPLASSLRKRGFNASSGGESRAALIMSPVILPIDQSQVLDANALFALYCETVVPTYAPPAIIASFEANDMVLKVVFPSESFIDSFIGLWNNSPRHHTDSLHMIKLSKRFASVFPAEEDTVGQGSVAVRGGGGICKEDR